MKDLKMKAESYTEGKINEILTQAVVQAYMDGYRDGYNDCENSIPTNLLYNQTEFVDLGLPSGTLWAMDYEKESDEVLYLPHGEANCLNIPTEEQWNELNRECRFELDKSSNNDLKKLKIVGPNGNIIIFNCTGMFRSDYKEYMYKFCMWLKDESNESSDRNAVSFSAYSKREEGNIYHYFSGYKLPVRLVKSPK